MRLSRIPMMIVLLLLGAGLVTAAGTGVLTGGTGASVASIDDDGTPDQGPGEVGHFDDQGRPETDDVGVLGDDDWTADHGSGDALRTLDDDDRGHDGNRGAGINSGPGNADDDDDNGGPGNGDDGAVDNSGPGNARDEDEDEDDDDDDDGDTTDESGDDDTTDDTDNSGSGSGSDDS